MRQPRLLVTPLLALCIGLAAAPRSGHAEDLLQVYAQARTADPVLAAADAARSVVHEGITLARAPLLPQASASASFEQTRPAGSDDNRARNVGASLNQAIVDVGALARLKSAHALADAQDAGYQAAEQALVVRVAQAYFNVLSAQDTLANVQANEDAYRQQVEQAEQRYRNGLSAAVDVQQARAYHASAQAGSIAARQALADAREALAEITGVEPGRLKSLRDELPMAAPQPADAQAWVDAAWAANPLLLAERANLRAAEKNIGAARAAYLPTLSASLGIGRGAAWPLPLDNNGRNVTTVGLVLSVPLFSGGAQQAAVRQALYQRDGALQTLEQRRRATARDVLAQYRGVLAAIGQTTAQHTAVQAAEKALASTRVGQGLGTQTMTDLLLAIQTLTAAQNAYSQARHQFILSRLQLQQAVGRVGESDLAAVNALLQ